MDQKWEKRHTHYVLDFFHFFNSLRLHAETLTRLTVESFDHCQKMKELRENSPFEFNEKGIPFLPPDRHNWEVLVYADNLDRLFHSANALAGAAFVILDDLVQSLAHNLGYSKIERPLQLGPDFNTVPVSLLLYAAANIFRHSTEWSRLPWPYTEAVRVKGKNRQKFESIDPLRKVLDKETLPLSVCVCAEVLEKICAGNYGKLEALVASIPDAMAAQKGAIVEVALQTGKRMAAKFAMATPDPRVPVD